MVAISDPTDAGFNSYATPAEVTTYLTTYDPRKSVRWIDDGNQDAYCIAATQMLDDHFVWLGDRTASGQNLEWPRKDVPRDGVYAKPSSITDSLYEFMQNPSGGTTEELDSTTIPDFLVAAVAEIAISILENPTYDNDGLYAAQTINTEKKIKVGSIEIENFEEDTIANLDSGVINSKALIKCQKYGSYKPSANTPGIGGVPVLA